MTKASFKTCALCSSALVALAYGSSAYAQAAAGTATEGTSAEEVVVTGSRVITNGFAAPTPVTVVSAEQMQLTAPNSLIDALTELPQFKNSFVPAATGFLTGGGTDEAYLNLRSLGITRTLVLLDGQRIVAEGANSTSAGGVDINTFPQALVKRVDVTTGGGTAQYGSDAIGGVVNFVLDTKFTGVKGEVRYGVSTYGDNQTADANLAFGTPFAGGRGHVIGSVEYYHTDGVPNYVNRPWAQNGTAIITNPNCPTPQTSTACPTRIEVNNVMPSNAASGGLVLTGATALKNNYFAGSQATLTPFNFGADKTSTQMSGGGEPQDQNLGRFFSAVPPSDRGNAYLRVSYDLTPNWNVYASGMYADAKTHFVGLMGNDFSVITSGFTIFSDNVYLPASVAALMSGPGATSLNLVNPATGTLTGPTRNTFVIGRLLTDWPLSQNYGEDNMLRAVIGADGKFDVLGHDWNLASYYSHSEAMRAVGTTGEPDIFNLYNAVDAVASPGGPGLPAAGTPICRSTITSPTNGCVPVNVLGTNTLTSQQWNYIIDGQANGNSRLVQRSTQDVAEVNIHGDIFSTWAGPISVGTGGSYRKEQTTGVADVISNQYLPAIPGQTGFIAGLTPVLSINGLPASARGLRGGWSQVNASGDQGSLDVKEVYGEALIPLAKDMPFLKALDLNGAIRYADYEFGGGQTNWKVGMVWQPIDDIRVRATESHDIRAPNLANLFSGINESNAAISDPFRRGTNGVIESNATAITYSQGNPALLPEIGDTFTMGIVYQPSWNKWVQGLSASVDYYNIIVSDAIAAPGANLILNQCQTGNTYYCQFVTRQSDPSTFGAGNTIGPITQVFNIPQNIGTTKNNGIDIEVTYRLPLSKIWEGRDDVFTVRALFNGMLKNQTFTLGGTNETTAVGVVTGGAVTGSGGNSDWSGTLNFNYERGPLTVNVQERFINGGKLSANVDQYGNPLPATLFINPNTTGNGEVPNHVPAYFYTDLALTYKFGKDQHYEAFFNVTNLFDKDPPAVLSNYFFYGAYPSNLTLYDTIGRDFTAGVRFKF